MQGLTELISHRLKFIVNYKDNLTKSSDEILILLLKEKKKQLYNEGVEGSLIKTLIETKISSPYQIEQFFEKSYSLMKLYDKNFSVKGLQQQQNIYDKIIKTYVKFFINQECQLRAEEVIHLYTKKICAKSLLLPTIFNWFADWARKTFKKFLKDQLHRQESTKKLQNQTIKKKKSCFTSNSNLNRSISPLPKMDLDKSHNNQNQLTLISGNSKLFDKNQYIDSLKSIKSSESKKIKLIKPSQQQWPKEQRLIVNRQVFMGAFLDQIQSQYKYLSIISDIDFNYLRIIKRNQRKEQFKNKLGEIAGVLSKYQGDCKKGIDQYCKKYYDRFYFQGRNKHIKRKIEKEQMISDLQMQNIYKMSRKIRRLNSIQKLQSLQHLKQKQFQQFDKIKHQTLEIKPEHCIHRQPRIILAGQIKFLKPDRKLHPIKNNRQISYANIQSEIQKQIHEMNKIFGRESEQKNIKKQNNLISHSPKFKRRNIYQKRQNSFSIRNSQQKTLVRELDDFIYKQQQRQAPLGIFYFPRIKQ